MEAWARSDGNLSAAAASKRVRSAVVLMTGALALGVMLAKLGVDWPFRLLLFFPFFLAINNFLQGLYRT